MDILNFFSRDAGQKRREKLDQYVDNLNLERFLPPNLRPVGGLLVEANPVSAVGGAMQSASVAFDPKQTAEARKRAAVDMGVEMAMTLAPTALVRMGYLAAPAGLMETFATPSVDAAVDMGRGLLSDATYAARSIGKGDPRGVLEAFQRGGEAKSLSAASSDAVPTIRAFHGSPHDFDRFDLSKIGTGEGAQAFGHGLYFAEAEPVARGYRDQLSRPYYASKDGANIAEKYGADVADIFERSGGDPQDIKDSILRMRSIVKRSLDDFGVDDVSQLKPQFYGDLASATIEFSNRADKLEELINSGDVKWVDSGRMYEVNIRANPEDFLDWDKPLSEQSRVVQDFANARWRQIFGREPDPSIEGEYIYKMASPQHGIDGRSWLDTGPAADTSRRLREAGILGTKYFDAFSRNAGKGSRNYVVFDDKMIDIVRKYGIAGAAALLGVSTADVQGALAQGQSAQNQRGLLN